MSDLFLHGLEILIQVLIGAIFGQVILSWLLVAGVRNDLVVQLYQILTALTEPLMRPLRRIVPTVGMVDITPMIAMVVLWIVLAIISRL